MRRPPVVVAFLCVLAAGCNREPPVPATHSYDHFGGRYFLVETATGSTLRLASICKVNIPFVGGALEDLILSNIRMLFDAEEAFTADWVAKHH